MYIVARSTDSTQLSPERPARMEQGPRGLRAVRAAWVELLRDTELDHFLTMTFSDDYARKHGIYTHRRALDLSENLLRSRIPEARYFLAAEDHFNRDVPHIHGLVQLRGEDHRRIWAHLHATTQSRVSLDPVKGDPGRWYVAKYVQKDAAADSVRFDLPKLPDHGRSLAKDSRPRRRGRRRR